MTVLRWRRSSRRGSPTFDENSHRGFLCLGVSPPATCVAPPPGGLGSSVDGRVVHELDFADDDLIEQHFGACRM